MIHISEQAMLTAINSKQATQRVIAKMYACLIVNDVENSDWEKINTAIKTRWSMSAIKRVKKMAWKRIENK